MKSAITIFSGTRPSNVSSSQGEDTKMDLNEFIEEFLIACDFVDEVHVTGATRFDEIADFDSLAMLGVIVLMETRFGVSVTAIEVMELETLSALHARATGGAQ